MADAMVSVVADRVFGLMEKQARHHINLVRGAEDMVSRLAVDLRNVRNVLDDAENRRFKDKKINYWLSRLEQTAYEMEDILDEWEYALLKLQMEEAPNSKQKVCSFIPSSSCLSFKKVAVRHSIGNKILSVKAKLDEILGERERFSFVVSELSVDPPLASWRDQSISMLNLAEVHGRDQDRDDLVNKIMDNSGGQEESGFRVLSIVGAGGLGKTTLAQMVYNDSRVVESFELRIWVCVSDPFDLTAVAKRILESIKVGSSPNTDSLDVLFKQVKESTSGRKFLLVLDDVWTEDPNKWKSLKDSLGCDGGGSKILVTSRSERVVKVMGSRESDICRPELLSDNDSGLLLCSVALQGKNDGAFEDIGKKIAEKCKGLPLAVKTLGSLLCFKCNLEQWSIVLDSEIWQMEEAEVDLFPHLLLSYNELSPTLKHCFSYCAFFPKDTKIVVEKLIQNWMALGYLGSNIDDMELIGRKYFNILAMRSLFQDFEIGDSGEIKCCKMHDIVHDFARFLKNKSKAEAKRMKRCTARPVCNPSHVYMVNEFCTLYCDEEALLNICDCVVRTRVLKSQLFSESIPRGMKNLIHLRRLILAGIRKLSREDLKVIFQLYYMQSFSLSDCGLDDQIPKEIGNLIHLRFLNLRRNRSLKELPMEIGNLIHLSTMSIDSYGGSKFPRLMVSPLNQLRDLSLRNCSHLASLPPFGRLPCLEHIQICIMRALEIVGREFLGITRGQGEGEGGDVIAFPKLKSLTFWFNTEWEEWEDITEEEAKDFVIMPCLKHLEINVCDGLRMLPHRLLSKVSSLKTLDITGSTLLQQRYNDKDGSDWKAISINNPALCLISDD